jgi:protein TonB
MRDNATALPLQPRAEAAAGSGFGGGSMRFWLAAGLTALLAACATRPPEMPPEPPVAIPAEPTPPPVAELPPPALISHARTPLEYRKDGASHLYGHNGHRIFKGKMPPLLHAVGVLQVEVDNRGNVRNLNWMRAPSHVPDVMREIERTVQSAAPFPAPVSLGGVVYTDVWLWDRSGHFQLDTLTEGQRNR